MSLRIPSMCDIAFSIALTSSTGKKKIKMWNDWADHEITHSAWKFHQGQSKQNIEQLN
jgi:hypothetical protein